MFMLVAAQRIHRRNTTALQVQLLHDLLVAEQRQHGHA